MSQTKIDTAKAIGAAGAAAGITIADFNSVLSTISILLSIGYIIWKWHKDAKK